MTSDAANATSFDIEALRDHRARSQWTNWMKDLRTELYQLVYEQPLYPKNLYRDRLPYTHAEYRTHVTQRQIDQLHERGIWVKPWSQRTDGE